MVICIEYLRLARANEEADREFRVAHEALMKDGGLLFRRDARSAVILAHKKCDECRTALRLHTVDHECAAVTAPA
jgi:hypothetical protein